ncbi:MAG: glycosyltransferase family 4 protein [Actinomycetota bacterium]
MRVAFVPAARLLSDRAANGEALIAAALLRALAARGHDVIAYCERAEGSFDGIDVREISVRGPTVGAGRIAFARRIARDCATQNLDVVHLLFPFTTADGYTLAGGAPLVVGPVNLPWPQVASRRGKPAARLAAVVTDSIEARLHRRTLARADRILVTGSSSYEAIPLQVRERAVEIPFGVDVERFGATPLPHDPVIVFFSVLSERKGVRVLLEAMPHVLRRIPAARLVIAGDDPTGLRPALEARARELGVAVEFIGAVEPAQAPEIYARARVVCQPSFGEPFGMTVVEAMASGRPVVATGSGGIPDAIVDGRGGRLVPRGDERLLADALASVLADPLGAEAMGAFNRARAERRFALARVAERIELTYEALAAGRSVEHAHAS